MNIGIRGMGLIGGSFEKAFIAAGHKVFNLKNASPETIGECGLVVVCLPPLLTAPWIKAHADDFAPGTLVTDAAGVKQCVCADLEEISRNAKWTYVGGHPMAGKERNGYANSDGALFRGASMIFTPYEWTDAADLQKLEQVFREIGFKRIVRTDPRHHDQMIAYTSQLAHVVSSAYVRDGLSCEHIGYSAGSYQDMTRVATVDPGIWTDLFVANREQLSQTLERLIARLGEYRDALADGDSERLKQLLAQGRQAKERELRQKEGL